nr:uncharacterized protein LOC112740556 [Arachis hypogaea]
MKIQKLQSLSSDFSPLLSSDGQTLSLSSPDSQRTVITANRHLPPPRFLSTTSHPLAPSVPPLTPLVPYRTSPAHRHAHLAVLQCSSSSPCRGRAASSPHRVIASRHIFALSRLRQSWRVVCHSFPSRSKQIEIYHHYHYIMKKGLRILPYDKLCFVDFDMFGTLVVLWICLILNICYC